MATAPPNTEDVPRELSVSDAAVQFVTLLRLISTIESCTEILPKETGPELTGPMKLVIYALTATATAPPIACTRVTRAPGDW